MNKIERLLLNLKWEIERYEEHGIVDYNFTVFKKSVAKAEAHYRGFKKKTGILNVVSKKSYIPNG